MLQSIPAPTKLALSDIKLSLKLSDENKTCDLISVLIDYDFSGDNSFANSLRYSICDDKYCLAQGPLSRLVFKPKSNNSPNENEDNFWILNINSALIRAPRCAYVLSPEDSNHNSIHCIEKGNFK